MNVFSSIDTNELSVTGTADELWYKDAIIYQLHVRRSPTATTTASATLPG